EKLFNHYQKVKQHLTSEKSALLHALAAREEQLHTAYDAEVAEGEQFVKAILSTESEYAADIKDAFSWVKYLNGQSTAEAGEIAGINSLLTAIENSVLSAESHTTLDDLFSGEALVDCAHELLEGHDTLDDVFLSAAELVLETLAKLRQLTASAINEAKGTETDSTETVTMAPPSTETVTMAPPRRDTIISTLPSDEEKPVPEEKVAPTGPGLMSLALDTISEVPNEVKPEPGSLTDRR
ncbi:hypothetical protein KIPB_011536, partial [Kipferlia bialata]